MFLTHDEFKRWLAKQGATFAEGKRHTKVYLDGRMSILLRHGRQEIPGGALKAIKK